jgi:hypothetical protein
MWWRAWEANSAVKNPRPFHEIRVLCPFPVSHLSRV